LIVQGRLKGFQRGLDSPTTAQIFLSATRIRHGSHLGLKRKEAQGEAFPVGSVVMRCAIRVPIPWLMDWGDSGSAPAIPPAGARGNAGLKEVGIQVTYPIGQTVQVKDK
jgi:hypothetical protein